MKSQNRVTRVFHKLDKIGYNDYIGIIGFTTEEQISSNKMLPQPLAPLWAIETCVTSS